jgi:hypothetical protein
MYSMALVLRGGVPGITPSSSKLLRRFAAACFCVFALTVLLMPAISDGYSPVHQTISEGVLERYGHVQAAGLVCLAAGSFALAAALGFGSVESSARGAAVLLAGAAAFVVLLTIAPADDDSATPSLSGRLHNVGATLAYVAVTAAMTWAALARRWSARSGPRWLLLVFPLAMLIFAVLLTFDTGPRGLVQRLSVGCELVWLLLVAWSGTQMVEGQRSSNRPESG